MSSLAHKDDGDKTEADGIKEGSTLLKNRSGKKKDPEKYNFIKELVEARKEGKDGTPFLAKMEAFMKTLKEDCEKVKERVKGFDYKAKDDDKMKLMDDFLYKTLTQN